MALRGGLGLGAVAVVAALVAAAPAAGGVIGGAARACKPPAYPGSGYFIALSVHGTSCATGSRLALAYHRCRVRDGRAGRCDERVLGFRCRERRTAIPTEIDARVTCTRGTRRVVHVYQQNT